MKLLSAYRSGEIKEKYRCRREVKGILMEKISRQAFSYFLREMQILLL